MNRVLLNNLLSGGKGTGVEFDKEFVELANSSVAVDALNEEGKVKVVNLSELRAKHEDDALRMFMQSYGVYVLPTEELIEDLRYFIPDVNSSIEIGSGNGLIAKELGLKATDSYMQSPTFKAPKKYKDLLNDFHNMDAAMVQYGSNVLRVDAHDAVKRFKPQTVLGCFVTHKYSASEDWRGGNVFGVDFDKILLSKKLKRLIFVGNKSTHSKHPLLERESISFNSEGLFTRNFDRSADKVFIFDKDIVNAENAGHYSIEEAKKIFGV